ncbi:hypothetical protein MHK_000964 [Candidatus Magnetomorum sp. HK-1]|nr:hypothetical protein MHK_000964 [Candidatus Magnetomorum sp. HK-1]
MNKYSADIANCAETQQNTKNQSLKAKIRQLFCISLLIHCITALIKHEVFTLKEFHAFLANKGTHNPNTRKSLLTYYRKQGHII